MFSIFSRLTRIRLYAVTNACPTICAAYTCLRVVRDRAGVEQPHAEILEPCEHALARLLLVLVGERLALEVDRERRHAGGADHAGRGPRGALEIAADAVRVLAVEGELGRHAAEAPRSARR